MMNWFSTREPRVYNGKRTVSSTNDVWKTGYPHAKEQNETLILYHCKKSTQNGLMT